MTTRADLEGRWTGGTLPANVRLGAGTLITGDRWTNDQVFRKYKSKLDPALVIGERSRMDGVLFNLGEAARVTIGDDCRFEEAVLVAEQEISIGSRVHLGWRVTIVDSDFHPIQAAEREQDVIAISPLGGGRLRPAIPTRRVVIEDDVWIGPGAIILKGTRIGAGAFVEPGAVVSKDIPPRVRVIGNPATISGGV
jgi:acetyltransferase-like isoleucine patch superfamily enzyme